MAASLEKRPHPKCCFPHTGKRPPRKASKRREGKDGLVPLLPSLPPPFKQNPLHHISSAFPGRKHDQMSYCYFIVRRH